MRRATSVTASAQWPYPRRASPRAGRRLRRPSRRGRAARGRRRRGGGASPPRSGRRAARRRPRPRTRARRGRTDHRVKVGHRQPDVVDAAGGGQRIADGRAGHAGPGADAAGGCRPSCARIADGRVEAENLRAAAQHLDRMAEQRAAVVPVGRDGPVWPVCTSARPAVQPALSASRSSTSQATWPIAGGGDRLKKARRPAGSASWIWLISTITGPHWPNAVEWS